MRVPPPARLAPMLLDLPLLAPMLLALPLLALPLLLGCPDLPTGPGEPPVPEVQELPMSGYVPLEIDLAGSGWAADEVDEVEVAGINTYGLEVLSAQRLRVTVQGAPAPGPAEVALARGGQTPEWLVLEERVRYLPPLTEDLDRIAVIGASLGQGVQGGVPSARGALVSPGALIARQAGAFHTLPLLIPGLFPQIGPEHVGPAPACEVPDVVSFISQAAASVLVQITDEDGVRFELAREDPEMIPLGLGVGGARVREAIAGTSTQEFAINFLAHLVHDAFGPWDQAADGIPWQLAADQDPDVILCVDLYGNDLISAVVQGSDIDLSRPTPQNRLLREIEEMVDLLQEAGPEVLLATLPLPGFLPAAREKRRQLEAAGGDLPAFDAALAEVDSRAEAANALLIELAADRSRIHLVPLASAVAELAENPLELDGQLITTAKLGGLIGLDGVHFSDTGYAMVSNLVLDVIEDELGIDVPRIDLAAVAAADPASPAALLALGIDVDACFD